MFDTESIRPWAVRGDIKPLPESAHGKGILWEVSKIEWPAKSGMFRVHINGVWAYNIRALPNSGWLLPGKVTIAGDIIDALITSTLTYLGRTLSPSPTDIIWLVV